MNFSRLHLPTLALLALTAATTSLSAEEKKSTTSGATTAAGVPAAKSPAAAASSAAMPSTVHRTNRTPAGLRDLPGRVIIAEILTWDEKSKQMRVRNLRNEEFDLVFDAETSVQSKEPLKVGDMIRTRFAEKDGRNVPLMVRVLDQQRVEKAKEAMSNPEDQAFRGEAAPKTSSSAAAPPASK